MNESGFCDCELVISIKPRYADLILSGRKTVEIRKKFSAAHEGKRGVFYVSRPRRALEFTAHMEKVLSFSVQNPPPEIIERSGVDMEELRRYLGDGENFAAILLGDIRKLARPIGRDTLVKIGFRPPMSHGICKSDSTLKVYF